MKSARRSVGTVAVLLMAWAAGTEAQDPKTQANARAAAETALVARGWSLLGEGRLDEAVSVAEDALKQFPRSSAALDLTVEAVLVRDGIQAGLERYERWLDRKTIENAYVVRRLARGLLTEASRDPRHLGRLDAVKALAADGDESVMAALTTGLQSGNAQDRQVLAAMGDERAVREMAAQAGDRMPVSMAEIRALGESGSAAAVPALIRQLDSPRLENRAAAAEALGRLKAREALEPLRRHLTDTHPGVRLNVAAALYLLDDGAGAPVLAEFEGSEFDTIKLALAQAIASRPDARWEGSVRALSGASDPLVRVQAAELLAKFDRPAAQTVLEQLLGHESLPIREAAERALAATVAGDLSQLRRLMQSPNAGVRVLAAGKILELMR